MTLPPSILLEPGKDTFHSCIFGATEGAPRIPVASHQVKHHYEMSPLVPPPNICQREDLLARR